MYTDALNWLRDQRNRPGRSSLVSARETVFTQNGTGTSVQMALPRPNQGFMRNWSYVGFQVNATPSANIPVDLRWYDGIGHNFFCMLAAYYSAIANVQLPLVGNVLIDNGATVKYQRGIDPYIWSPDDEVTIQTTFAAPQTLSVFGVYFDMPW